VLGDLFYHLGAALGGLGAQLPGKHGAAMGHTDPDAGIYDPDAGIYDLDAGIYDPETGAVMDLETDEAGLGHAGELMAGAAGAWLVARVLRPGPVSWTRVVIAGIAATFLADLAARTLDDGRGEEGASDRVGRPAGDDPEALLRRYGAGIALSAGYASLLYPRLPGPPLLRGLAFGALEVAASRRGGLVRLAAETPGLRFPLQGLALPPEEDTGPLAHLAFGLGLGLFYRADS
jgi:hypothetical protein